MDARDYHKEIVTILDFGSQYTQLIARKVRELGVYCEIFPYNMDTAKDQVPGAHGHHPVGRAEERQRGGRAHAATTAIFDLGVPILGICYGIQLIAKLHGGEVQRSEKREYGRAHIYLDTADGLLEGMEDGDTIWMSHGDAIMRMPPGFVDPGPLGELPLRGHQEREREHLRRPVPSRGPPYAQGQGDPEELPLQHLQGEGPLLHAVVHRDDHARGYGRGGRRKGGLRPLAAASIPRSWRPSSTGP